MTARPRVTVVTPTYNMADRLPRCVSSVAAQTYPNVEHIVVDGASTDGTVDYLRAQPELRWVSEPDAGQSNAINKGFAMATGGILTWLNADDELTADAAQMAADLFVADPSLGFVYGELEEVSGSARRVIRPVSSIDMAAFRRGNVIFQPGTFFTRQALEAAGGVDETFHLAMDFDLWLRMMDAGVQARYVPRVMARFELHPESKTGSQGKLAFAQEEARAHAKHGRHHEAAMVIDRWYWDDVFDRVIEALEAGDRSSARAIARTALPRLHPVVNRSRAFLWATRLAPAVATRLIRFKRHRPL